MMRLHSWLARFSKSLPPVTTQFEVAYIQSTLLLKACGFIREERGEVRDVGEGYLTVRIGSRWWRWWLSPRDELPAMELSLTFAPLQRTSPWKGHPRTHVSVTVRSLSRRVPNDEFQLKARQLLWRLRSYFIAAHVASSIDSTAAQHS